MTKVPFSSIKSEDIWCLDDEQDHLMDLIDPDASMDDELFEHVKYLIEKGLRYLLVWTATGSSTCSRMA